MRQSQDKLRILAAGPCLIAAAVAKGGDVNAAYLTVHHKISNALRGEGDLNQVENNRGPCAC